MINLPLPLIWGVIEVVVEVKVVEVVTKGVVVGRGLHKCTDCHGENHTVNFCWELYGKPLAHHASFQVKEQPSQSLPPTSKVVSIHEEEYNRLVSTFQLYWV